MRRGGGEAFQGVLLGCGRGEDVTEGESWAGLGRAPGQGWGLGWATGGGEVGHLCTEGC